ncbi:hypothetical protein FOPG_19302 [Fusarium oxysporum f. sp. conglutinans race 2 54008]|uniref:Uncharacterized protein n=1 Tax=Fusarium oxysporum f. sp. conglutinans race 2 54008 TaxID=1089457 RepID=X0GX09_FUSOX|nr:hypothetical protein FOPG_19302 [Fusarium oxysporum f. sp. conglutinans race 2 54008]
MFYRICSPSELWGAEVGLMLGYSGAIEVFPARIPSRKWSRSKWNGTFASSTTLGPREERV